MDPVTVPANEAPIDELLALAADDVACLWRTIPHSDNAHDQYRGILLLGPGNVSAQAGIDAIPRRYVELNYRRIENGEFDRAESYIQKATDISSNGSAVAAARRTLIVRSHSPWIKAIVNSPKYQTLPQMSWAP